MNAVVRTEPETPEEIELLKKERLLARLADRLAIAEEDMADLRAEQGRFEAAYTMNVARLYAEFDEIEAEIAEEEQKLVPDDEEIKKKAEELRRRAEESAARAAEKENADSGKFEPTAEAKKAYRDLARAIHPDLAIDAAEKEKRHGLMAELNLAYSSGDQTKLNELVEAMKISPDMVAGDSIADRLVRSIRQIYQVKLRLKTLGSERTEIETSELYELRKKAEAETKEGRDMLAQMAARTEVHIRKSRRRLENLRMVNSAQEDYVKEKFGMDIKDFRKR
jgi:hypothetical protein